MNDETSERVLSVTRRRAIMAGLSGAVVAAGIASGVGGGSASDAEAKSKREGSAGSGEKRMPVAFAPHGGGPWPWVDVGLGTDAELSELTTYLQSIRELPSSKPKALLVVSAHWEEPVPTVMSGKAPP